METVKRSVAAQGEGRKVQRAQRISKAMKLFCMINDGGYLSYHTVALISHASKVMLKILQARLQQYMT